MKAISKMLEYLEARARTLVFLLLLGLLVTAPTGAQAYEFATDSGEPDGTQLRWKLGAPIHFTQHVTGNGEIPSWQLQAEARKAFQAWAELPEASVTFVEDAAFAGPECPHALPEGSSAEDVCGGPLPPHDFRSALFFIETEWPFGEEVIALTTLSWQENGELVDADISFNGLDYRWSVGTEDVFVDFRSIALHEVGHFLGLAHSQDPSAVMRVDYEEGQLVRTLGADDAAGIAALYPCNQQPCVGGIAVESSGCSMVGRRSLGLAGVLCLGLLLLPLLRSRRGPQALAAGMLLCLTLMVPTGPRSSTALILDVDALTERADRVVRADVVSSRSWRDGIVWTEVTLAITEEWKGTGSSEVTLQQPGGVVPGFGTRVFGIPGFTEGEDVVVFLDQGRVLGLAQGKFAVDQHQRLTRDLSGLTLARVGGHRAPSPVESPATLEGLRASVVVDDL